MKRELRIGNYVNVVDGDDDRHLAKVTAVGLVDLDGNGSSILFETESNLEGVFNFEPIEVNEELLLKLGLEEDNFFGLEVLNIKYLHQLQNLYFLVTGRELTF